MTLIFIQIGSCKVFHKPENPLKNYCIFKALLPMRNLSKFDNLDCSKNSDSGMYNSTSFPV